MTNQRTHLLLLLRRLTYATHLLRPVLTMKIESYKKNRENERSERELLLSILFCRPGVPKIESHSLFTAETFPPSAIPKTPKLVGY